jgi:hypothetical protein
MFTISGFCDDAGNVATQAPGALMAYIRQHFKGKDFTLTVKAKGRRQGSQAMRYYRGVVVPDIAVACGYEDTEDFKSVHESLAWKFLRIADHPQLGYPRRRSTSKGDLTSQEMSDYISQCVVWAETNVPGCRVRRPEEADLDDVYAPDYDAEAA